MSVPTETPATTPAPVPADMPRVVTIQPAVWQPFLDWTHALGIQLVTVPRAPGQAPRYAMTPVTAYVAASNLVSRDLSGRELQVLRGMASGMSNGAIARLLFLSEDTVKTHARRMYRVLGAKDRAEAVAHGFRRGILQ